MSSSSNEGISGTKRSHEEMSEELADGVEPMGVHLYLSGMNGTLFPVFVTNDSTLAELLMRALQLYEVDVDVFTASLTHPNGVELDKLDCRIGCAGFVDQDVVALTVYKKPVCVWKDSTPPVTAMLRMTKECILQGTHVHPVHSKYIITEEEVHTDNVTRIVVYETVVSMATKSLAAESASSTSSTSSPTLPSSSPITPTLTEVRILYERALGVDESLSVAVSTNRLVVLDARAKNEDNTYNTHLLVFNIQSDCQTSWSLERQIDLCTKFEMLYVEIGMDGNSIAVQGICGDDESTVMAFDANTGEKTFETFDKKSIGASEYQSLLGPVAIFNSILAFISLGECLHFVDLQTGGIIGDLFVGYVTALRSFSLRAEAEVPYGVVATIVFGKFGQFGSTTGPTDGGVIFKYCVSTTIPNHLERVSKTDFITSMRGYLLGDTNDSNLFIVGTSKSIKAGDATHMSHLGMHNTVVYNLEQQRRVVTFACRPADLSMSLDMNTVAYRTDEGGVTVLNTVVQV